MFRGEPVGVDFGVAHVDLVAAHDRTAFTTDAGRSRPRRYEPP